MENNRLYFLVKDPHWTFLWWGFAPGTTEEVKTQNMEAGGQLTIRVYDVTHILFDGRNAHFSFDIDVSKEIDHYYLNIWASDRNYLAEIGIKYPDGRFLPLARSNTIYLPRDHASDETGETWSTITL
jgi:hypothetical protein